ncbi:MAG: family 10 glycosylhydrolase [Spirulinaceae cyanobacterium]
MKYKGEMKQSISQLFTFCIDKLIFFSRRFGRKAWLIFLVIFSLVVTTIKLPPASSQVVLNDIQGYWGKSCVQQLAQQKIISGYPDGSFKPNLPVTRAEFAAIVSKAFSKAENIRSAREFRDLSPNYWAIPPISRAVQTGFLVGYPDGTFQPDKNIPRVEVLLALVAGLNQVPSTAEVDGILNNAFADANQIPPYAKEAIAAATEKKLVVNYPNVRQLQPQKLASRGEVAAFLCQALGYQQVIPEQYVAGTLPSQPMELRGVWLTNIDSDVLFSRSRLAQAISTLDQLNFNTLYPTVWNWGYTLYPSQVAQRVIGQKLDPEPGLQNRDMLQEVISIKRDLSPAMDVIPWFEFGFMAPADSELAKRHPDWLTNRLDGDKIWLEGNVHERVWLNPLHPEVQKFITDLVVEVVSNYDIDGIQFDDHFGIPSDFGYDSFSIKLYQQEHNGKLPPNNYEDPEWMRWRAGKITNSFKQVFQAVKKTKPAVLVGLSPNPHEFAYEKYLQDWHTWEREGYIEELIVQVYRRDLERFKQELAHPSLQVAKNHIPTGIGILSGIKPIPIPLKNIQQQVQTVREQNFAGVSFFFYESLWNLSEEPAEQRQSCFKAMFPTAAKRPSLS